MSGWTKVGLPQMCWDWIRDWLLKWPRGRLHVLENIGRMNTDVVHILFVSKFLPAGIKAGHQSARGQGRWLFGDELRAYCVSHLQ